MIAGAGNLPRKPHKTYPRFTAKVPRGNAGKVLQYKGNRDQASTQTGTDFAGLESLQELGPNEINKAVQAIVSILRFEKHIKKPQQTFLDCVVQGHLKRRILCQKILIPHTVRAR